LHDPLRPSDQGHGHGRFDGQGEGPEYETIFGVGTICGVDDLAAIIKANYLCNELGIDTLEGGIAIGTAMEWPRGDTFPKVISALS